MDLPYEPPSARVVLGTAADVSIVDVPLIRGAGDPRPRVEIVVDEDLQETAILDLASAEVRCGWATASRLGLRVAYRSEIDTLRIGEVLIHDLPVELGGADELVIGVGALPDLGVAVLTSRGVVRFGDDPDAVLADVGTPIALDRARATRWWERGRRARGAVADAIPARLADGGRGDLSGWLRVETATARSALGADVRVDRERRRGGVLSVGSAVEVDGIELPSAELVRDESLQDPRPEVVGVLGADLLASVDVAVDPATARVALRPVEEPRWTDLSAVRLAWLERESGTWTRPPGDPAADPASARDPAAPGDPGNATRHQWAELAALRFAAGDLEGARLADDVLARAAGDRCELHHARGIRRLRSGDPDAADALRRAAALYDRWVALTPAERQRVRDGKRTDGLAIPQRCPESARVLAAIGRPLFGWSEQELRERLDPAALAVLASRAQARGAPFRPTERVDPHPLTTALLVGEPVVRAGLASDPDWLAGRVVLDPGDARVRADVAAAWVRRPGDPALECLYALVSGAEIPDLPEADCLSARLSRAAASGDSKGAAAAASELVQRWPDVLPGDPVELAARIRGEEEPMIPLMVLSTTASAGEGTFDHGYSQLARFLDGAVTATGSVDYDLLATRRPVLDGWLDQVKAAEIASWTNPQKLALYVNAYNGYTISLILDAGQPNSIRDLDGGKVWDTRKFVVAGESLTLNQIENERARPLADGRVHAVLNCASKGCPPLPTAPLVAATLEPQLDAAAKRWVATNAFRVEGSTIALSSIFDWYSADFARENRGDIAGVDGKEESALWFLSRFADEATKKKLTSGTLKPTWQTYDWTLNDRD